MNEDLILYKEFSSFRFSGENFDAEFAEFKRLHDGLGDIKDRLELKRLYAALPQSLIDRLPYQHYEKAFDLYQAVSARLHMDSLYGGPKEYKPDPPYVFKGTKHASTR